MQFNKLYIQSLDSDEGKGSIIRLPADPSQVTDEENIANLDKMVSVDVSGQVELKVKHREGRNLEKKKIKRKKRKVPITNDTSDDDTSMEEDKLKEKKAKKK